MAFGTRKLHPIAPTCHSRSSRSQFRAARLCSPRRERGFGSVACPRVSELGLRPQLRGTLHLDASIVAIDLRIRLFNLTASQWARRAFSDTGADCKYCSDRSRQRNLVSNVKTFQEPFKRQLIISINMRNVAFSQAFCRYRHLGASGRPVCDPPQGGVALGWAKTQSGQMAPTAIATGSHSVGKA